MFAYLVTLRFIAVFLKGLNSKRMLGEAEFGDELFSHLQTYTRSELSLRVSPLTGIKLIQTTINSTSFLDL